MLVLKTNDNEYVEFKDSEANLSVYLKTLFYDKGDIFIHNENKIESDVVVIEKANKKMLTIVKKMCYFVLKYNINNETLLNINNFSEEMPQEIQSYLNFGEHFTENEFFELIDIVNFMDIELVLQILKKKLNYIIKTKTIEDIMEIFKLKDSDFTKKENDAILLYKDMLEY